MATARYKKYANLSGRSGVAKTKTSHAILTVQFLDGSTYTYTTASAGQYSMRRMRQLAQRGLGLNGYINTSVKANYASKDQT